MIALGSYPLLQQNILGTVALITILAAAYVLVESAMLGRGRVRVAGSALVLLVVMLVARAVRIVQLWLYYPCRNPWVSVLPFEAEGAWGHPGQLAQVPFVLYAVVVAACATLTVVQIYQLRVLRHRRITPDSVKEALDALPDGVCFSATDGTPLLVNAQMDTLAHDAFGTSVGDVRALWKQVLAGDCVAGYVVERTPGAEEGLLLVSSDERAWQFAQTMLEVDGRPIVETIAADVTSEHALARQLGERNRHLAEVNQHLRAYGRDVARLTREEEVLATKVRVHDEVGRALVALRVYERQAPEQRDREGLLGLWRRVVRLLEGAEREERPTDDWTLLCQAAEAIDVRLELVGDLPTEEGPRALAVMVVHECLNNAVRHGEARAVQVCCTEGEDGYELRVTNDGRVPAGPAEESGGLANLRAALERAGDTLEVRWMPQVEVVARIA